MIEIKHNGEAVDLMKLKQRSRRHARSMREVDRTSDRPVWWVDALCSRLKDRSMFDDHKRAEEAIEICLDCPVMVECGLARGERRGVWGGQYYSQRAGRDYQPDPYKGSVRPRPRTRRT